MTTYVVCICGEPGSTAHPYRVLNLMAATAAAGAPSLWMTIDEAIADFRKIRNAGLLVLWRTAWDSRVAAVVRAARESSAIVLFDADDFVIDPDLARVEIIDGIRSQGLTEPEVKEYFRRTRTSFEAADYASCSTEELAIAMRALGKRVSVIPNGFDKTFHSRSRLAVHRREISKGDGLVRIGYATGTRTHQRDFGVVAAPIASVLREKAECRLVLFRDQHGVPLLDPSEFEALNGLENCIEWRAFVSHDELPDEVARFDINIAPLEVGNPFCEAKSELKFVQAALVDVCTVASPTGPFRRAILDGNTGFLAADADSWSATLHYLLANPMLRQQVGRSAYAHVVCPYGPERRRDLAAGLLQHTDRLKQGVELLHSTRVRSWK